MKPQRRAVSELYASMLMVAITLSFGGAASSLALGQFGQSESAASVAASVAQRAEGTQVSYVFSSVSSPGACPSYRGSPEGTLLSLTVFDYGSSQFAPVLESVNGTVYTGPFGAAPPGGTATLTVQLTPGGTCAHQAGQAVFLEDAKGVEVQFGT